MVTECDCLCPGITSSLSSADRSRDRPATDAIGTQSLARYAGAGEGLHFDYMASKISCFLTATTTTTTTTTTTAAATTTTDVSSQLVLNGAIVRRQDRLEHSWRSVVVSTA